MALAQNRIFTMEDIYNLPEGERAELIDGQIYMIPVYLLMLWRRWSVPMIPMKELLGTL